MLIVVVELLGVYYSIVFRRINNLEDNFDVWLFYCYVWGYIVIEIGVKLFVIVKLINVEFEKFYNDIVVVDS